METTFKVMSTPNIMKKAFENTSLYSIRYYKVVNFTDPEPSLPDDEWETKYGDVEILYEVVLRYPECKGLTEGYTYKSWNSVKRTLKKKIKASF